MTEHEIRLEARFIALERFACHTHNMIVNFLALAGNLSAEQINEIETKSLEELRLMPVLGADAALSDVLSDEVFQDLSRLNSYARDLRAAAKGYISKD